MISPPPHCAFLYYNYFGFNFDATNLNEVKISLGTQAIVDK
jgi:hypothetical protein